MIDSCGAHLESRRACPRRNSDFRTLRTWWTRVLILWEALVFFLSGAELSCYSDIAPLVPNARACCVPLSLPLISGPIVSSDHELTQRAVARDTDYQSRSIDVRRLLSKGVTPPFVDCGSVWSRLSSTTDRRSFFFFFLSLRIVPNFGIALAASNSVLLPCCVAKRLLVSRVFFYKCRKP